MELTKELELHVRKKKMGGYIFLILQLLVGRVAFWQNGTRRMTDMFLKELKTKVFKIRW